MKNKILIFLLFFICLVVLDASKTYANSQFSFLLGATDTSKYYLDTATLTVTKDDNNRIYYDTWLMTEKNQETQELNLLTNQFEPSKRTIYHIVFIVSAEKKMAQTRSFTSYTNDGKIINTHAPVEPKTSDINNESLLDAIKNYVSSMNIKPIASPNEKYLPINKKEFFDLFEARGYKFNEINEVPKYNPYKATNYTAFSTPYSFFDKVIEKEVHLSVAGDDNQHLKMAHIQFALEGPNYEQRTKKFNLPSKEKLSLFYMMLQVLYPDWPKEESKRWIDDSIATMNKKNALMFIHLHKDKEYIKISRQPVQGHEIVQYVLEVSQQQPSSVNPYQPYYEDHQAISVYEEWKELQRKKQASVN